MILTIPSPTNPNLNGCTVDGSPGGDQSPELSWTGAPEQTRSFVVILYDESASFTHWAMYNIPARMRSLPANAGIAGSSSGLQMSNDFGDLSYDGPCPPITVVPLAHH
jgi:Raf kinase inhibitor-like YbhB/YbcL family protein